MPSRGPSGEEAPRSREARVVLSAGQLRVSQRISQAAMRRAKALSRRLGRGLTGGDIRRGTITRDVLARAGDRRGDTGSEPPRPSRTVIRTSRPKACAVRALGGAAPHQPAHRPSSPAAGDRPARRAAGRSHGGGLRDRAITAVNLAPALSSLGRSPTGGSLKGEPAGGVRRRADPPSSSSSIYAARSSTRVPWPRDRVGARGRRRSCRGGCRPTRRGSRPARRRPAAGRFAGREDARRRCAGGSPCRVALGVGRRPTSRAVPDGPRPAGE